MKILIGEFTKSIEPVGYFEPEDRYKSADDEDEFMDYREDEDPKDKDLDWMNR